MDEREGERKGGERGRREREERKGGEGGGKRMQRGTGTGQMDTDIEDGSCVSYVNNGLYPSSTRQSNSPQIQKHCTYILYSTHACMHIYYNTASEGTTHIRIHISYTIYTYRYTKRYVRI